MNINKCMKDDAKHASMSHRITCANLPLAQVYVRSQKYEHLNSPLKTLKEGTLFTDLYDPYKPRRYAQGGRRHE